jgi:NADH pyrophosphatase NudC (nudix superfamily)
MVAASILPVSIHKGKMYFLFGKENEMEDSAKGFSDFGGKVENGESIMDTALREGAEELCGFFGETQRYQKINQKKWWYL